MKSKDEDLNDIQSMYERAIAFHQEQRFDEARGCYQLLIDALPNNADLLHLCGLASYQLGDAEDAQTRIRAAIELNGNCGDYHSNLGLVLKALGRNEEAIESFHRALILNPDAPDFLNNLGNSYIADGQTEQAEQVFRRLLEAHPSRADGLNNLAVLLAKEGQEAEALRLYENALELQPSYIDARVNLWQLLMRMERYDDAIIHQRFVLENDERNAAAYRDLAESLHLTGHTDEALGACKRALALRQDDASCHVTTGNVLQSLQMTKEAEEHYRRALEIDPDNARARNNIGTILMASENTSEALEYFIAAARQDPEFVAAVFNQGSALQSLGRPDEAIAKFKAAILLKPDMQKAYRYLAELYRAKNKVAEEEQILKQWLVQSPDSPVANYLLSAIGEGNAPIRAPDDFVREEFDEFADEFEKTLARLDYRTPEFIGNLLIRQLAPDVRKLNILDAGCGTGLCAPFLRPLSKNLVGVDLSSKMIDVAAKKKLYDELITAELVAYMSTCDSQFDVMVSADTLVYFGPLEEVIAAAARALKTGGTIVFSIESLEDDEGSDFRLNASGRYSHTEEYARRCLDQAGFEIDVVEQATLRTEMRAPVEGLLILGRLSRSMRNPT